MNFIKLKSLDTLFFRTGRPFTMGEETWAEIVFPPFPSTLYGALRSFLIFQRGTLTEFESGNFKNELGTLNEKGTLKIKGPLLLKDELLFPCPLDLVRDKSNKELQLLEFLSKPRLFISDYPLNNVLINKSIKNVDEPSGFLTSIELADYLQCKKDRYSSIEDSNLFVYENKTGIARDRETLTSREGFLYRIPMVRLKEDVYLAVKVEGVREFPASGVLQLGGEGKGASFEKTDDLFNSLRNIKLDFKNRFFKIYLATPAIFEKGWLPEWINEKSFEGEYNGIKVKLVGCSIGRSLDVGGWDIAKKRHKPLLKAVPQGSVYYFKIMDGSDDEIIKTFHLQNISDVNPEEGFGLSLVGGVKLCRK